MTTIILEIYNKPLIHLHPLDTKIGETKHRYGSSFAHIKKFQVSKRETEESVADRYSRCSGFLLRKHHKQPINTFNGISKIQG